MPRRTDVRPMIVVIGSLNIDLVSRVRRLPGPGETLTGESFHALPGGKGANQAVAAARLGGRVHMIGRVGDDAYGRQLRAGLKREGIDVRHVQTTPGVPTGCATILVDRRGENSIVVTPGANGLLTPADIDSAEPLIRRAAIVVMQLEVPLLTILHANSLCRRLGVCTIVDPAPVPVGKVPSGLLNVDLLTPNETEAAALMGKRVRWRDADVARSILELGPRLAVLKLGKRGAFVAGGAARSERVQSFPVKAIDTTAAGDAFTGALAVAIAEGQTMLNAVRFANAAGALCCTKLGAQPAMPSRRDVEALIRRHARSPRR
jgi:ribokinase